MNKLKTILQSNKFYYAIFIILIIYIVIFTKIIKYESSYISNNVLEGIITDIDYKEDKITFTLKAREKVICNLYTYENSYDNLLGKKVKINGTLKDASNNTIPNTFNYKKYLYNNKIYKIFTVSDIEVLKDENVFYKLKNKIINRVNSYDDTVKSYLNLFILGDKSYLDSNIYDNYRVNGIWHLFAVSGMHIGLIISVLSKMLSKIKRKNIIISLVLFYFMFLTNFSASVMRATIFFYLKIILDYFNIKLDSQNILFLTAFIILFINPFMIYNTGFQYSFLITFSIMHESSKITGNYFIKILKISILSFLVSMPITVNMNYEINILSVFLNVIYVPFISLIIFPLSILTFILKFLTPVLKILILVLEKSNYIFNAIKLNLIIPKIPVILIIIYYLLLYLFLKSNKKKYLILIIVVLLINRLYLKLDSNYYVYFFDVSQGDSALIITPYQKHVIMIDTGGISNSSYNVSDNILTYLKSIGITKINTIILTHGDYDHMGDSLNIINNFKVKEVIFNCGSFNELEINVINKLTKNKISYSACIKELNYESNKLSFINDFVYDNENDNSIVIYTKINNYKFLFMGDASSSVEENILKNYDLDNINVLKVGHHGSKTSSNEYFINKINPRYSIISVGKNNLYGHPNKDVLNVLNNSKIYRTDIDGSIIFKISKNKLQVDTYEP